MGRLDWHMDLHYTGRTKPWRIITSCRCSKRRWLDWFLSDLATAYDALDDKTKKQLEKPQVVYSFRYAKNVMCDTII